MAGKEILLQQDARAKLLRGVDATSRAVRVTLGPRGHHVLIDRSGSAPAVTKDGVSVARQIELADRFENMGAQMVKEAAIETSDAVGDGTTTATVLAGASSRRAASSSRPGTTPWTSSAASKGSSKK